MQTNVRVSRRDAFKSVGALGACLGLVALSPSKTQAQPQGRTLLAGYPRKKPARPDDVRKTVLERVFKTPMIDTHEHLPDETDRLAGGATQNLPCDDWSLLLSHYLNSDLLVAGMPKADLELFLSPKHDPLAKWNLIAPYWPAVKNTGYAQAVRIAIRELYGVDELSAATVSKIQAAYEKVRRTGFYDHILHDLAGIESCQVNDLGNLPFRKSKTPSLLMQDIGIMGMLNVPSMRGYVAQYAPPAGIEVKTLDHWHGVIDWWFNHCAPYAVAVKSQHAYSRDIDYARVPGEKAEPVFLKVLQKEPITPEERRTLEDHLFWYCVDKATAHQLPVKLHTGYYAGQDSMPLGRLIQNPGSAATLCRSSPATQFVFLHIGYPHYEAMLALTKNYSNAHIDMCWSWIINPVAAKDFFKKHIVTAPANKLLPFGGDYIPVEPVLGHAILVRRGVALALSELVDEGWLSLSDALELVGPIFNGNARRIFRLPQKLAALKSAPWIH